MVSLCLAVISPHVFILKSICQLNRWQMRRLRSYRNWFQVGDTKGVTSRRGPDTGDSSHSVMWRMPGSPHWEEEFKNIVQVNGSELTAGWQGKCFRSKPRVPEWARPEQDFRVAYDLIDHTAKSDKRVFYMLFLNVLFWSTEGLVL